MKRDHAYSDQMLPCHASLLFLEQEEGYAGGGV